MKLEQTTSTVVDGVEVFPIPSLHGYYSISRCGRVWSHDREVRCGGGSYVRKGCWVSIFKRPDGYPAFGVCLRALKIERSFLLHRVLSEVFKTDWEPSLRVDHRDRDRSNSSLDNLRLTDHSSNMRNFPPQKNSKSGLKGVHVTHKSRRAHWQARIHADGVNHHLGYFDDPIEAAKAYDAAAIKFHGDFAYLNFPDQIPT